MDRRVIALWAVIVLVLLPVVALAQQPTEATDVTREQIEAVRTAPEGGVDRQVKVVDIGKSNVAVGILHRNRVENTGGPVRGIVHTQVTEVYYITSGGGTLVTGGNLVEPRDIPSDSPIVTELVGASISAATDGGQTREVEEGDVVVIPAGVFHGWRQVDDHVTYLSIRPDPDKVLPAGYVNPVAK